MFLNFAKLAGKHRCWSLFLIELHAWKPAALLKRNYNTGVFQWNLRYFLEHLFYRAPPAAASAHRHKHAGGNLALFEVASYKPLALLTHITQTYTSIETSQLICNANQLTGFYMSVTFVKYGLRLSKTLTLRTKSCFYMHGS